MAARRLTLALAHYDRHVSFLDGTVSPDGVELVVKEVGQSIPGRDGNSRHERMLREREFDAAEVSLSSYLVACERGEPFTALPVVPRRLFSQSLFFVRGDSPLRGPQDLVGKRVGLNTWQTTLSVLAKGDLEHEYQTPWKEITWVTNNPSVFEFGLPAGVRLESVPADRKVDGLLLDGDLDAAILPHPPSTMISNPGRVRRLFPNAREAEQAYYRKLGYWPIMHLVAIKQELVDELRWLPKALYEAFQRAKERTLWHYEDPNWSVLAWGRHYLEDELSAMNGDPWPYGVAKNRANLERFMAYSLEQGFIKQPIPMEQLFHESLLDT